MAKIYHILGADIHHHNHTLLQFFSQQLMLHISAKADFAFWVMGKDLVKNYPQLHITEFNSQLKLVKKMVCLAKQDKDCHFFLHGQFNFFLWFAILFYQLPIKRITWHIWGADLYEDSQRFIFKLLYPLRRMAQKRMQFVVGTQGDLAYFQQINANAQCELLYFPTKMPLVEKIDRKKQEKLTILVGNSGDPSNQHLNALRQIEQKLGKNVHLIIPMGYPKNNQAYIEQVRNYANTLFLAENIEILENTLEFETYLDILAQCDLGCFLFQRQQGIGTISLLIYLNIPLLLNTKNPFIRDLTLQQIPFLLIDDLTPQAIEQISQKLTALNKNKIAFLAPNYTTRWINVMNKIIIKG